VAKAVDIAGIIAVLGAAGNAAFDVYTIVDDPKNTPLTIVSLIIAPLSLTDVAVVAKAAQIRRGISTKDIAKLGDRVAQRITKLKAITGSCEA
jgi:chitinase